jgi:hypothetical protein
VLQHFKLYGGTCIRFATVCHSCIIENEIKTRDLRTKLKPATGAFDAMSVMMAAARKPGVWETPPPFRPPKPTTHGPDGKRLRGYQCVGCQDTRTTKGSWTSPLCNCTNRAWCQEDKKHPARCPESGCVVDFYDENPHVVFEREDDDIVCCCTCRLPI